MGRPVNPMRFTDLMRGFGTVRTTGKLGEYAEAKPVTENPHLTTGPAPSATGPKGNRPAYLISSPVYAARAAPG
jgi:hypothetical protein